MKPKIPLRPSHPERICWGCELYCSAQDMRCGNGSERAQHPIEYWGEGWMDVGGQPADGSAASPASTLPDAPLDVKPQ